MASSCVICYEDCVDQAPPAAAKRVTRRKNAAVSCPYCSATFCCACVQTYMLGSFQDPHCCACKRAWNDEFLDATLSRTFRTGALTQHRQSTWLERQRALLPGRQHLVATAREERDAKMVLADRTRAEDVDMQKLVACSTHTRNVQFTLDHARSGGGGTRASCSGVVGKECIIGGDGGGGGVRCSACGTWTCTKCKMSTPHAYYMGAPHVCLQPVPALEAMVVRARAEETGAEQALTVARRLTREARTALQMTVYGQQQQEQRLNRDRAAPAAFVRACPFNECRGFLSTAWKCGTCARWACPECHEPKGLERDDASHVCKPDNIASAQLLRKETRPCPSCGSAIFKIAGCDQMWCTACNTGFDWKTGQRIQEGRIHNPHFFEYMRNNVGGAAAGGGGGGAAAAGAGAVGGCGGQAVMPHTEQLVQATFRLSVDVRNALFRAHGRCAHIREVARGRLARLVGRDAEAEQEVLSVAFLLNDISEMEWKQRLQRGEKRRRKYQGFLDILDSYVQACTDVFAMLMSRSMPRCPELDAQTAARHEQALYDMACEAMHGVCRVYQCKMPANVEY